MELEIKYKKNLPNVGGNKNISLFDDSFIKTPERFLEVRTNLKKARDNNAKIDAGEEGIRVSESYIAFLEEILDKFLHILKTNNGKEIDNVVNFNNKSINYFGN